MEEEVKELEERCVEEEDTDASDLTIDEEEARKGETEEVEEKINSIFNKGSFDTDSYVAYNIFIIREGDTLDSIMEKYNITEEELKKNNDLSNLQLGDKIIIPNSYERD